MTSNFGSFWYELALLPCLTAHLLRDFSFPEEIVSCDNSSFSLCILQDIQAEIDAHNDIYKSVDGNKSKMVKALGSSEEAVFLQHRLDDMNQRWSDLKAKSANIRWVNLYPVLTDRQLFVLSPVSAVMQLRLQCSALFLLSTLKRKKNILAKALSWLSWLWFKCLTT